MKTPGEAEPLFRAGLYLRLSKDDEGSGESASISTQRDILMAFAKQRGIPVLEEFVDDGYSGTHFDRPDFRRMIAAIEAGTINCVITKDLSRLGRNSAGTAELIEEYFPRHRVRFISVTDGFDSLENTNGMAIAAPFVLLVNECYARDISRKIRASLQAKMKKGDFISPFAPYGYRKDPENRNRLLVDEEAAAVVRFVFRMAAEGRRPVDIAHTLNERQVPTPAEYRRLHSPGPRAGNSGGCGEWSSPMLCKMLRNPVYLGRTEQGKTTKLSFKSKETLRNRREDWIVVEGTHEPLIPEELFKRAGKRVTARRRSPKEDFHNLFSGIARCADCGHSMTSTPTRKAGSTCNLCCGRYKAHRAEACTNHFIEYDALYRVVQEELHGLLRPTEAERLRLLSSLRRAAQARTRAKDAREAEALRAEEQRLQEVDRLIRRAFELSVLGGASDAVCGRLLPDYEKERAGLAASIRARRERLEQAGSRDADGEALAALLDETLNAEKLSPDLLHCMIERIEVEQGHYERDPAGKRVKRQTIRIYYRFKEAPG